jgi:hypothetical protein
MTLAPPMPVSQAECGGLVAALKRFDHLPSPTQTDQ